MIKRFRAVALCALLAPLGGCGQYLGNYRVEAVRMVPELPMLFGSEISPYGQYFDIELSSATSLAALGDSVGAVYVKGDFCPIREPDRIVAFGPVSEQGESLEIPSMARQQRQGADGRFHYHIFLVVAHPMAGVRYSSTAMERPTYDLRKGAKDVCLRLFAPGYNLIPSRSGIIRIPAHLLRRAARQ